MNKRPGGWSQAPQATEAEIETSRAIDDVLRKDRIDAIRSECSILILGPSSAAANGSRQRMALHFAKKLAGDQKLVVSGDNNEQIEVFGMVDGNKNAKEWGMTWGCLLQCHSIGDVKRTAVCLLFSNCRQLKECMKELRENEKFNTKLGKYFSQVQSNNVDEQLLGISSELENAAESFSPLEVRTIFMEESLEQDGSSSPNSEPSTIAEQVLGVVKSIQLAKIEEVENMDMACGVQNIDDEEEPIEAPQPIKAPQPKKQVEQSLFFSENMIKLALFGVFVATSTLIFLRLTANNDQQD